MEKLKLLVHATNLSNVSPVKYNLTIVLLLLLPRTVLAARSNEELTSGQVSTLLRALIPAAKATGKAARLHGPSLS